MERASRGEGPTLLEAKTVRWSRHSAVAAGGAGAGSADRWKETDPIPRFRAELIAAGVLDEAEAVELEQSARVEIEGAVEFALASPYPELSALTEDIYA